MPEHTPQPKSTDRLFFAVFPGSQASARMHEIAEAQRARHGLRGKPLKVGHLHVSLHHFGDFPGVPVDLVEATGKVGSALAAGTDSFEVVFDRVRSFSRRMGRKPLVLLESSGNERLAELHQRFLKELRAPAPKRPFAPHVTLLYDEKCVAEEILPEPIRWTVSEIVLIDSLIGQSRFTELGKWQLRR
jgi:2'-5' RNA ligase